MTDVRAYSNEEFANYMRGLRGQPAREAPPLHMGGGRVTITGWIPGSRIYIGRKRGESVHLVLVNEVPAERTTQLEQLGLINGAEYVVRAKKPGWRPFERTWRQISDVWTNISVKQFLDD